MKGLVYSYLVQNKRYWIGAAAVLVLVAAVGFILIKLADPTVPDDDTAMLAAMFIMFMPLIAPMIALEPQMSGIEKDSKIRYLDYQLSGVTVKEFLLAELAKCLFTTLFGAVMLAVQHGVFLLADSTAVPYEVFVLHILVVVMTNVFNLVGIPLTLIMKSAEKAGLLLGLVLGAAVSVWTVVTLESGEVADSSIYALSDFCRDPVSILLTLGVCAVISALSCLAAYAVIKRGDLC